MRGINRSTQKKKQWPAAISLILFFLLLSGKLPVPKIFVYNRTASLPVGWYLILPSQSYQLGDIVVFQAPEKAKELAIQRGWFSEGELMMKRIGALENMSYRIDENGQFYVEKTYMGQTAIADRYNRPMPQLRGTFTVGPGTFLPVSKNPNSFDGRYYGSVPLENIRCKVVPFLTTWQ